MRNVPKIKVSKDPQGSLFASADQPKSSTPVVVNRLADNVRNEFEAVVSAMIFVTEPTAAEQVEAAGKMVHVLQKDAAFCLKAQDIVKGKISFMMFENLPCDRIIPIPPTNGKRPASKETWVSEIAALAIMMVSGYCPMSFREEKGDELIHQVAPAAGKEDTISSGGKVSLDWHTDNAILAEKLRPTVLLLIGLINEDSLPTVISNVDEVFIKLNAADRQALMSDNYRIPTPDSFDDALKGMKILSAWSPLVSIGKDGVIRAGGNLYAVKPRNEEAQKALLAFRRQLSLNETPIVLDKGKAVLFDNARCFHRRGQLSSGKRWLQRVFGTDQIELLRSTQRASEDSYIFDAYKLIIQDLVI